MRATRARIPYSALMDSRRSVARYWWILTRILTMKRIEGNVGAVRRSPIGCSGQLAGVSKVVRYPTHPNASDGFCLSTNRKN